MHYYHQLNHSQRRRFVRRISFILLLIIVSVAAISLFIFIDNQRTKRANEQASTSSAVTTTYFAPNVQIFRSAYFQFQATSGWSQAVPESNAQKFVYRSMRGTVIDQELTVYVNREAEALPVTRVLPVTLRSQSELLPTKISDNCSRTTKASSSQPVVQATLDGVSFTCTPNDARYNVMVGLKGGTTKLILARPDGTTATYVIYYSNVTAVPEGSQLVEMLGTFQSR